MKQQIFIIHGGESFNSYQDYLNFLKTYKIDFEEYRNRKDKWRKNLGKALGSNYEVIVPDMPSMMNAKYMEWKIWFEKFIEFMQDNLILIGHSQGGIFLAKYLSENILPKKIKALFLVAPPFDDKDAEYSLADFALAKNLENISKQTESVFLYFSKDDPTVPFGDLAKYQKELPNAKYKIFEDKGHFRQEDFPELAEEIKSLS